MTTTTMDLDGAERRRVLEGYDIVLSDLGDRLVGVETQRLEIQGAIWTLHKARLTASGKDPKTAVEPSGETAAADIDITGTGAKL